MRRTRLVLLLAGLAACGGTESSAPPDAGTPPEVDAATDAAVDAPIDAVVSNVCEGVTPPTEPPAPVLAPLACTSVTPTATGTGTAGELMVAAGGAANGVVLDRRSCSAVRGASYDTGEAVVRLTGLTPGVRYLVRADSAAPGGYWANVAVLTGCDDAATTATCAIVGSVGQRFVAPPSGTVRVMVEPSGGSATYAVRWSEVECLSDAECGGAEPHCTLFNGCTECASSKDCTDPARPVCGSALTCVAGPVCDVADDPAPPAGYEGPDDGPIHARPVTAPAPGASPVRIDGIACAGDRDHVALTIPAGTPAVRITASPIGTWLQLETGATWYLGESMFVDLAPGTYPLSISRQATAAYRVEVAETQCARDSNCPSTAPRCYQGTCGPLTAGPSCAGEVDPNEVRDDHLLGATPIAVPAGGEGSAHAAVCRLDSFELDWFRVDVADGERLDVELEADVGVDLDLVITDAAGRLVASAATPLGCELAHASALPAGSYYLQVSMYDAESPPVGYTVRARRSVETCASAADCVALTDVFGGAYRATCDGGACRPITATGQPLHAACDSNDDCAVQLCTPPSATGPGECTLWCTDDVACAPMGADHRCTGQYRNYCDAP